MRGARLAAGRATAGPAALVWGTESHRNDTAGRVTLGNLCGERGVAPAWRCGATTGLPEAEGGVLGVVCAQVENSLVQGDLCCRHTNRSQIELFIRAEAGNNVHASCFLELCTSTPMAPFTEQKVEEMCFSDSPFSWNICGH